MVDLVTRLRWIMNKKVIKDPNFKTVLKWVRQLRGKDFSYSGVPLGYVNNPEKAAELIDFIDETLINNNDLEKEKIDRDTRMKKVVDRVRYKHNNYWSLDGLSDRWVSVFILSLWWGCLASAKLVAYRTRSGVNTVSYRREKIKEIDKKMSRLKRLNLGFELGFKAGPYLRQLRGQGVYFFGIPKTLMKKYNFDEIEKSL